MSSYFNSEGVVWRDARGAMNAGIGGPHGPHSYSKDEAVRSLHIATSWVPCGPALAMPGPHGASVCETGPMGEVMGPEYVHVQEGHPSSYPL